MYLSRYDLFFCAFFLNFVVLSREILFTIPVNDVLGIKVEWEEEMD